MKIEYLRRLGQNKEGTVVDTDTESGEWLIAKGHAKKVSSGESQKSSGDRRENDGDVDDKPVSRTPGRPRKAGAK